MVEQRLHAQQNVQLFKGKKLNGLAGSRTQNVDQCPTVEPGKPMYAPYRLQPAQDE
jgi:hypothetical protein